MATTAMWIMILGAIVGTFFFLGWIVWLETRQKRERQESDIELRSRMLEKFGTSDEFVGFMQTEAGKRFLDSPKNKAEKSWRKRVASSVSWGAILTMLGIAFLVLGWGFDEDMMIPGVILIALGIGLAITAYVYHRLAPNGNGS